MTDAGKQASMALLLSAGGRDQKRVRDILELRRILEPEIAALAARHAKPGDLARLRAIVAEQEREVASGREGGATDDHFHLSLARITGNEILCEVAALLHDILSESRVPRLLGPERSRISLDGHKEIVEAVERGDAQACRTSMLAHLDWVERAVFSVGQDGYPSEVKS